MTLSDTIDLVKRFMMYDLDAYYGDAPTDAQYTRAINWSMRTVAKEIGLFDHSIPITLTDGKAAYEMRDLATDGRKIVSVKEVVINGVALNAANGRIKGVWALDELNRAFPQWRTMSGSPVAAVVSGTQLILCPAPTATTISGGANYVSGHYLPADLVSGVDSEIPLPVELHEPLAALTAVRLATPTATEQAQMARLSAFAAEWQDAVKEMKQEIANNNASWGTTYGETPDYRYL